MRFGLGVTTSEPVYIVLVKHLTLRAPSDPVDSMVQRRCRGVARLSARSLMGNCLHHGDGLALYFSDLGYTRRLAHKLYCVEAAPIVSTWSEIFFAITCAPASIRSEEAILNHRYKIRTFEARDGVAALAPGTVVLPMDISFSLDAASVNDVERMLCENVRSGKLAAGRIYQICPSIGNTETIRSVAIDQTANASRIALETTVGMYSMFRRIRYAEENAPAEALSLQDHAVPA
jgi:hypothetical protein